jgi:hypothetical protein
MDVTPCLKAGATGFGSCELASNSVISKNNSGGIREVEVMLQILFQEDRMWM